MSRTRKVLFGTTLVLYAVVVLAVLAGTDLVRLDWQVMLFRPYKQWPGVHALLDYFVVLGQRGPTAVLVMAWLGWRSWRQRTLRPLLVLGASLLLLNASVGAIKIGLGRLGPHHATSIGSTELFAGGDIFPSGHTANAVVTWGILAYLATTPRARRVLSVVAASFALTVGATTVFLGTHWVSDVLLGWAAGLAVLLALPWCEPALARAEVLILRLRERLRTAGSAAPTQGPATVPPAAAHQRPPPRGQQVPGATPSSRTRGSGAARESRAAAPSASAAERGASDSAPAQPAPANTAPARASAPPGSSESGSGSAPLSSAAASPTGAPSATISGSGPAARLYHPAPRQHPLPGERQSGNSAASTRSSSEHTNPRPSPLRSRRT